MNARVSAIWRILRLAVLLLGVGGAQAMTQPAAEDAERNPVLTDRLPYCEILSHKAATLQHAVPPPHAEADWLASEGNHMCAIGLVQQGIRRLRFAILQLMEMQGDR